MVCAALPHVSAVRLQLVMLAGSTASRPARSTARRTPYARLPQSARKSLLHGSLRVRLASAADKEQVAQEQCFIAPASKQARTRDARWGAKLTVISSPHRPRLDRHGAVLAACLCLLRVTSYLQPFFAEIPRPCKPQDGSVE